MLFRSLTEETHGNATGTGLADVVTRKLALKIDEATTRKNIVTSGFLERGKLPVIAETEEEAFDFALRNAGIRDASSARVIWIRDTLSLGEIRVSKAIADELRGREGIEMGGG